MKKHLAIIQENEQILRNFFEIEKVILKIHSFNDFITELLKELRSRFKLQYAGITFFKGEISSGELNVESYIKQNSQLCKFIDKNIQTRFLLKSAKPRLDDSKINKWNDFFPSRVIKTTGSIAVIPLWQNENMIGSLNLADCSKDRYNPKRETIFLERLAVLISICIDNIIKHELLRYVSNTDEVTGLANRRNIYHVIEKELQRSAREKNHLSILYIDLDDFKKINDSYGHDVGDLYLKDAANILAKECRSYDYAARYGGDEFIMVLCHTNSKGANAIRKRIQKSFSRSPYEHNGLQLQIQASIGVATTYKAKLNSVDKILKEADKNLYIDKDHHKSKKKVLKNREKIGKLSRLKKQ